MPSDDTRPTAPPLVTPPAALLVFIVEDDAIIRHDLRDLLKGEGWQVKDYASAEDFLEGDHRDGACLVLDADLLGGIERLRDMAADAGKAIATREDAVERLAWWPPPR